MNILFTVCGRAGSKGIKNKNIQNFVGYPLPYYTLSIIDLFVKKHPEHVCISALSTDSHELMTLADNYEGIDHYKISRDSSLTGDYVAKVDVVRDCYIRMKSLLKIRFDVVIDLDVTSPLRKVIDIENIINKYMETKCDIAYSVVHSRRNPYFNMVKKKNEGSGYEKVILSDFTARQQAPEIYDMNASIYAYSPEWLNKNRVFNDSYSEISLMPDTGILDLDYENDLELMQVIAKHLYETNSEYGEIRENLVNKT